MQPNIIETKMEIIINKQKHLKQIQEEFQKEYPYLKLEFYSGFHKQGEGSDKKNTLDSNLTVGEAGKSVHQEGLNINGTMKVSELEKAFKDMFGLSAQVFRKSNNLWLQTTLTDSWSLSKQNQNAMEMNEQNTTRDEPEDYHEQE